MSKKGSPAPENIDPPPPINTTPFYGACYDRDSQMIPYPGSELDENTFLYLRITCR
jgi:hypothetical protein